MTLNEITYLIESFNEALKENASYLCGLYTIDLVYYPDEYPTSWDLCVAEYRVVLSMYTGNPLVNQWTDPNKGEADLMREHRREMAYYPLDTYELEDFFGTVEGIVGVFDKSKWFSNWKKSTEREFKLRNIGI